MSNLSKRYNTNTYALDGISFTVDYGKVFGFLGPNGAGKTTTIKILTTLIRPTSGTVKIFDKDIVKNAVDIRKDIGVVLQQSSYESRLTVKRSLDIYGILWGISTEERKYRIKELLEIFDLEDIKDTRNEDLSIGQRRRVQVAREFMHEMKLLFLDEPTVGLDPSARRSLLDYIKKQVNSGLTVFFTTHIMEEAEYLCHEIAIINKGKIIISDTPAGLKQKYGGMRTVDMKLKDAVTESVLSVVGTILGNSSRQDIMISDAYTLRIRTLNAQESTSKILEALSKKRIQVENISINPPSLEEAFLSIVSAAKG